MTKKPGLGLDLGGVILPLVDRTRGPDTQFSDHYLSTPPNPGAMQEVRALVDAFAGNVWMLSMDPSELRSATSGRRAWAMPWALWFTALFFGPMTFACGRRMFDRRPQLCMSPNGVFWRNIWGQRKQFAWSQIDDVHITAIGIYGNGKMLVFTLPDHERRPRRGIGAWPACFDRAFGFGDVRLGLSGFDHSADDILAAAHDFLEKADSTVTQGAGVTPLSRRRGPARGRGGQG